MTNRYHHGNLRSQVLEAAAKIIAAEGADALSMRDLARQAGVSHAAPAHHFGDRRGLFTALAADGFTGLADALLPSVQSGDFSQTAVAYVAYAVSHPGHYSVMFRTSLLDADDPALGDARQRAGALLQQGLGTVPDERILIERSDARRTAWAVVHGIAGLTLSGALPGVDAEALTLAAARQLFGTSD
ncbi:TetR/AcrR family transcriptional regulator [Microbacterium esteraromaticum]|uniref:TetR/AcrR family transcriptional regulator n=1 Tax=Microbacterium esteraromaticum TaxID=57043 RepID=UPI0019563134|nr:TetR/AcrR family transcriptional regulator [Microbacterium esteraromaticum]MBM7466502.1 AcrR family transcriptional regulator [Microbacterium esteraromaticum]